MPLIRIAALLAVALEFARPAAAQATYRLEVSGTIDHTVNCWETVPLCSGPPHEYSPWTGTLTVVLDSAADGVYAAPGVESLSFTSAIGAFSITSYADPDLQFTVAGGRLTSLEAFVFVDTPHDEVASDFFDNFDASYSGSGGTHYGGTVASGTLAPVPEPAPAALLLGALAAVAAMRRTQPWTSGQRGLTSNA